ncbi:MAG: FtsX-like permease family protein [Bacillota bacterium]|nr:FtsX-like permease family protein [Bacillota bacterium]
MFAAASPSQYESLYNSEKAIPLTITGILRLKDSATKSYLSQGIAYTSDLTDYILNDAQHSDIAAAQKFADKNVLLGTPFADDNAKEQGLLSVGADSTPTAINIYSKDYAAKDKIKTYLDAYNNGKSKADQEIYFDAVETITNMTTSLLDVVTLVLVAFAAISLIVSSIMIGIITYISVIERTKEIGILRSVGSRKKNISRVFNAETLIVGFTVGVLGVGIAYLLCLPINVIIFKMAGISGLADLSPINAIILRAGSMLLTIIPGFLPSRMAAKKDPVEALRTE